MDDVRTGAGLFSPSVWVICLRSFADGVRLFMP